MKRRIAVLGNAWSIEYIKIIISGMRKCAEENNIDLFFFMNYSLGREIFVDKGEANIFHILDVATFDGVILLSNTFHLKEEFEYLESKLKSLNVPVVSLEYPVEGATLLGTDNYVGMSDLCNHILDSHGVKEVVYVSGPADHTENNIRRQALEDALEARGLSLKEENIIFGNWNYLDAANVLEEWLETHALPDAVVCANDAMAMACCTLLESKHYHVPLDVIVTGFDHISTGIAFSPAIATVDRNWEHMGYQVIQYMICEMDGTDSSAYATFESKAVPSESCGCSISEEDRMKRLNENRIGYDMFIHSAHLNMHICDLADAMSKASSEEELQKVLHNTEWETDSEGEEFYLCLTDDFFSSLHFGKPLTKEGYTKRMNSVFALKDKKIQESCVIDTQDLIPGYVPSSQASRTFILLPLYGEEGVFGYFAFGDEIAMMYDYSLYSWIRHINQNLCHIRQNVLLNNLNNQLARLSVTDALTGVYNRMGYDQKAFPFLQYCHEQGKRAVLMFADINNLKIINDTHGHIMGDLAIRTVAENIRNVLGDKWIIVRYGGDEFLMVGECPSDLIPQKLLEDISYRLTLAQSTLKLPFDLSISVGYVLVHPGEPLDMSRCLTLAENAMYIAKKNYHDTH